MATKDWFLGLTALFTLHADNIQRLTKLKGESYLALRRLKKGRKFTMFAILRHHKLGGPFSTHNLAS